MHHGLLDLLGKSAVSRITLENSILLNPAILQKQTLVYD